MMFAYLDPGSGSALVGTLIAVAGAALSVQHPLKAPAGAIRKGVVQLGRDSGKPLFRK